jgi:hypothetical protein
MNELALPDNCAGVLIGLKEQVRTARFRVQRQDNSELTHLNWRIGRVLVERTDRAAWGDNVLQHPPPREGRALPLAA